MFFFFFCSLVCSHLRKAVGWQHQRSITVHRFSGIYILMLAMHNDKIDTMTLL